MKNRRLNLKNKTTEKTSIQDSDDDISKNKVRALKEAVKTFVEDYEHSRMIPDEEKTVTKKKLIKQFRLLNDSLLNTHRKFNKNSGINISYALFCRCFPFRILIPNANKHGNDDTSICIIHANIDLIFCDLKRYKITNATSPSALIKTICCGSYSNEDCLARTCNSCKDKEISVNHFDGDETVSYERWITKSVPTIINDTRIFCQKTCKETFKTTKTCLANMFLKDSLPEYMQHVYNIIHQYRTLSRIRNDLTQDEAFLHVDFPENLICNYTGEINSIALHTSVLYLRSEYEDPIQSFCSISQNWRHDPTLICAHLKPVLEGIKKKVPHLKTIHFQSGGSDNQYRNEDMFFLIAKYLSEIASVDNIFWHYSEVGHSKGATDWIGECLKRAAQVASDKQTSCFKNLISCLQENCKDVNIIPIDDKHVENISSILNTSSTEPYQRKTSIHQLAWSKNNPKIIRARSLSCYDCVADKICDHFEIDCINIT